jgi:hypothetical protein
MARHIVQSAEERFWERVVKRGGCWVHLSSCADRWYGQLQVNGRKCSAHRFSWELHNGPVPPGLWVLHRCDNKACVYPVHLFLGTHRDNVADREAKGRGVPPPILFGEQHPRSVLTDDLVLLLRWRWRGGAAIRALAREFGLDRVVVSHAVKGKTYGHLP